MTPEEIIDNYYLVELIRFIKILRQKIRMK